MGATPKRAVGVTGVHTYCVYCGDFNECQDHVTPVAYNSGNRKLDRGATVDCCRQFNQLAGPFVAETVIEKAVYLEERYQRKFDKLLKGPVWSEEELSELRGSLYAEISKRQRLRELIQRKLENLDRVINGYPPHPIRFPAV